MTNNDLISKKEVDRAIEKIREECTSKYPDEFSYDFALGKLLQELSQIESVNGWIDVKERLPEEWEYLVTDGEVVEINWYSTVRERFWRSEVIPTHWMPLPPPPIINKV